MTTPVSIELFAFTSRGDRFSYAKGTLQELRSRLWVKDQQAFTRLGPVTSRLALLRMGDFSLETEFSIPARAGADDDQEPFPAELEAYLVAMAECRIEATLVSDKGPATTYNPVAPLIAMKLADVQRRFWVGGDFRHLGWVLKEADPAHGPCNVTFSETELVTLICLYSNSMRSAAMTRGSILAVSDTMWRSFTARAGEILKRLAPVETTTLVAGHVSPAPPAPALPFPSAAAAARRELPGDTTDAVERTPLAALTRLVNAFGGDYPARVRDDMDFALEVIAAARKNAAGAAGKSTTPGRIINKPRHRPGK